MPLAAADAAALFERASAVLSQSAEIARDHALRAERAGNPERAALERRRATWASDVAARGLVTANELSTRARTERGDA